MTGLLVVVLAAAAKAPPPALTRPALDELAVRIVDQAEAAKPEAPVGVFVEGGPPVLARSFASALAAELSARKRGPRVLEAPTAAEAEAIARAHDVRTVLRLTVQLDAGKLVARGDAIHTWVSFWAGAGATRPGPAAALAASVDADAQALQLGAALPPVSAPTGPLKLTLTSLARLSAVPAAIAFGDVDGDGKPELVVLQEDGVAVFDLDGKLRGRADLRELPPASSPSREPFGSIAVLAGPPRIAVASSKKARAGLITFRAGRWESATADVPELLKPVPGLNVFEKQKNADQPFTAASSRGAVHLIVWPDGTAALSDTTGRFAGAGAGSVLADLDGDGTPELLLSSSRYAVDADELRVLSLAEGKALQSRSAKVSEGTPLWSGSTPRGKAIVALGVDLDGDRFDEVVLGVWLSDGTGELLVARVAR